MALNIQIPDETDNLLKEIVEKAGFTKTQAVILAIEFYAQELERRARDRKPSENGKEDE